MEQQSLDQAETLEAPLITSALNVVVDIPLSALEEDPYPYYEWMRDECPVVYVPETGRVWVLTWELCKEAGVNDSVFGPTKDIHEFVYGRGNIMALQGEEHRKIRTAANSALRPKQTTSYHDSMQETTRHYLEALQLRGEADVARDIFEPICQRAVGNVAGYGDLSDETLRKWNHALSDRLVDYGRDPEVDRISMIVKQEIRAYLERRLPELDQESSYTVLGHLMRHGMPEGEIRTIDELQPTAEVLIVGGFQEPAHLVSSTLYGLLTHPEQWAQAVADPDTWARPALEEGLRWMPPFGMTEKLTTEDVLLGDVAIPAGTEIAMIIGSANRDPKRFDRPNEFDINRADRDNVSFGFGSHFCIGHNVARALGEIILVETIKALPGLRLNPDEPTVIEGWQARGPKRLPVVWDA